MTENGPWSPTIERFSGYAAAYDTHRPRPPVVVLDMLTALTPEDAVCVKTPSGRMPADRLCAHALNVTVVSLSGDGAHVES